MFHLRQPSVNVPIREQRVPTAQVRNETQRTEGDWYDRRLTHLQFLALHRWNLRVTCGCGRTAVFDGLALWWLFARKGWSDRLRDVPGRLACLICRKGGGQPERPTCERTRDPPTVLLPLPDEREWKRLVSRYRV